MKPAIHRLLKRIYTNPSAAGSFGGVEPLYKAAHIRNKLVQRADVREFLSHQESYTLYRRNRIHYPRLRIRVQGPKRILSMDLSDFQSIAKENDGIRYLLVAIDAFSRFVFVQKLKSKTGRDVCEALEIILKQVPYPRLHCDEGREFYNKTVQDMLARYGSVAYSTRSEMKAAHSERVQRTLKAKLYKFMRTKNTWRWVDVVDKVIIGYNKAKHSAFRRQYTPNDVHSGKVKRKVAYQLIYGVDSPLSKIVFKLGDVVKIAQLRFVFGKAHFPQNSVELFRVVRVNQRQKPVTYRLVDFKKESVDGVFYASELIRAQKRDYYPFDIIRKRQGPRGIKQLFVHYTGWPKKFDQWINEGEVKILGRV